MVIRLQETLPSLQRKVDAEEAKENVAVNGQEAEEEGTAAKKPKVDGDVATDTSSAATTET